MSTDIRYNGNTIQALKDGESSTIMCSGMRMHDDIIISAAAEVEVVYGDSVIATLDYGQVATLKCRNKILSYDLRVITKVRVIPPGNVRWHDDHTLRWNAASAETTSYVVYFSDPKGELSFVEFRASARFVDVTSYCTSCGKWTVWVCSKRIVNGEEYISKPSQKLIYNVKPAIEMTPSVLGVAVLGRTILGREKPCMKFIKPVIHLIEIGGQLDKPSIYLEEFVEEIPTIAAPPAILMHNKYVRWSSVDAADSYEVYYSDDAGQVRSIDIEDKHIRYVNLTLYCTRPGTWTVWVRAKRTINGSEIISDPSETVIYTSSSEDCIHANYEIASTTAPTCTEAGYTEYICSDCRAHRYRDQIPALGHQWGDPYYSDEFVTGYGRICSVCGERENINKLAIPEIYLETIADEVPVIDPPSSVFVQNDMLRWYGVPEAEAYLICIENDAGDVSTYENDFSTRYFALAPYCGVGSWTLWVCSKMTVDGVECVSVPSEKVTYIVELPKLNTPEIYIEEAPPAECAHATCDIIKRVDETCTEDGYITYRCADCGYEYNEIIQSTGHIPTVDLGVDATCENTGLTEGQHCSTCGAILVAQTVIPALGHRYTNVVTAPTCTTNGYTTRTCSVCNHSYTSGGEPALGHDPGTPVRVREATCTVPAEYAVSCTRCGAEVDRYENVGELAQHIADGGSVTTEPTCTTAGIREYRCRECDTWLRDEVIDAVGHSWSEPYYSNEFETGYGMTCSHCDDRCPLAPPMEKLLSPTIYIETVTPKLDAPQIYLQCMHEDYTTRTIIEASCETDGKSTNICKNCGHQWETVIPSKGHKPGDPAVVRPPTCTVPVEYVVKCTVCNVELDRYEDDGEFAEHIPDGGRVTKEATCDTAGEYTYYCRECGTWVKTDIIPAFGHTWGSPYYSSEFSSGYGQKCATCGELKELAYVECDHPESAYHESIIINPWCTTTGSKTCSCDVCNQSWSVSIPALEHIYTISVTAPTCTAKGFTKYICSRCNHSYTDNETAALGHKSGNPVCVREATCTVAPEYVVYCTVCGDELDRYEDDGGLLEHVADGGRVTTQPTCMTTGIRKYYCRECSTWIRDEVVPATGHSYTSKVTAPTCTAKGYTTHTCTVCGHSYTDTETDPNGHFWGVNGGWATVTPATCESKGTEKHTCNTCGLVETRDIPATGHNYTSKVTAPTCLAKGYTTHTCSVCDHSYTDGEKSALGHDPGTPVRVREATCTVPAQYVVYCTRCNIEIDRYENDGEFAEHIADGGRITKYATCTTTGTYTYRCRECDTWLRDEVIAELGHDYQYDYTEDATCTDGGYDVFTCTRCKDWYTANETEPTGHSFPAGWESNTEPTCTESGTEKRVCYNPDCEHVEYRDVDPLGHDWEYYPDPTVSSGTSRVCRRCERVEEDV